MGHASRIALCILLVAVAGSTACDITCLSGPGRGSLERCDSPSGSQFCVNTETNPSHCGECGHVCGPDTRCVDSECVCPSQNLANDPLHCGVCGHACGRGEMCVGGVCRCPSQDFANDRANCGACGNACPSDARCTNGRCVCPAAASTQCLNACVDVTTDVRNCGSCMHACGPGQGCVGGVCACPISQQSLCSSGCRDLRSDETNCGACGTVCPDGESCRGGACACLRDDLMTNPAHCGSCGHRCPSGQGCRQGMCGCPGAIGLYCHDVCRDAATDRDHCGACDARCPMEASSCAEGRCVCAGSPGAVCGGQCRDLATDAAHCGACDHACAPDTLCASGRCLPRPLAPTSGARVATARPWFRWTASDVTQARVQVCADRACTRVVAAVEVAGHEATPTTDLAAGVWFWRVGDGMRGVYGPARAFAVGRRPAVVGTVVGTLSDVTGDGLADLLVGAPEGRVASLLPGRRAMAPGDALRLEGDTREGFGFRLAHVGDVNGDGYGDALLGGFGAPMSAETNLFRGSATGLTPLAGATVTIVGPTAGVGDIDGDGYADLAVGQPEASLVWLQRGAPGGFAASPALWSREPGASFGAALAAAWDVDADGFSDVLAGAPTSDGGRGAAYIGYGGATPPWRNAVLPRPPDVESFGAYVAGLGDVDGDGRADLLVGARGARAYVYRGVALSALPTVIEGPAGSVVRAVAAGDVDGDGYADVLLPLPATGRAALYRGAAAGLSPVPVALVDAAWARATGAVVGAGDLDGDGCADVAVGDPSSGVVRLFFGDPTRPLTRQVTITGVAAEHFGATLG